MGIEFTARKLIEDDYSVTLSLIGFDIVENGKTEEKAKKKLAAAILEYAKDFEQDFELWSFDKNRKAHIPYILAVKNAENDNIVEMIKIINV